MTSYVFKPRRRDRDGKSVPAKHYRGRFRLAGDYAVTEIALNTTDKQVAQKRLEEIVLEKEREREGLIAPKLQRVSAERPLLEHMVEYLKDLNTLGRDKEYIDRLETRIRRLITQCDWRLAMDITADRFTHWRTEQSDFAPKTLNDHLNAISSLLNWMVEKGRLIANPLKKVQKVDLRGRQAKRRAFTDEEFKKLLSVSNQNRSLIYLTAAYTGMRKGELIGLVWGDCYMEEERPYLAARAVTTKNAKDATIPLHPRLAAELLTVRPQDAKANDPVFPAMKDISHAIRRDIERAGIERIDAMGRKLDFHALRYTFATRLAREGTAQRTAQELMRHSDPKLTAQIYTDASQLPTFDAVKSLSWVDGKCDNEISNPPLIAPLSPDFWGPLQSRHGTVNHCDVSTKPVEDESDSLELAGAVANEKWRPHGDSNPGRWNENPVS